MENVVYTISNTQYQPLSNMYMHIYVDRSDETRDW